jgi:hypothetical protein
MGEQEVVSRSILNVVVLRPNAWIANRGCHRRIRYEPTKFANSTLEVIVPLVWILQFSASLIHSKKVSAAHAR